MKTFSVSPSKQKELEARFARLNLREEELEESFVRSSGAGGQNVNKVSTCVMLTYYPKAIAVEGVDATRAPIIVKCQKTRSQALNRYYARKILCEKLEQKILGEKSALEQKREKIRRQKRRRSRRAKEKMLQDKHHRSGIKKMRSLKEDY